MRPDFSDLDPQSQDGIEARELYEDFLDRQAEEQALLEEEKEKTENLYIEQPYNGPAWEAFINRVRQSNEATINLLNKQVETKDIKTPEGNQ